VTPFEEKVAKIVATAWKADGKNMLAATRWIPWFVSCVTLACSAVDDWAPPNDMLITSAPPFLHSSIAATRLLAENS
jgi:hypothetical protein